jgi:hypothetical protein
VRTFPINRPVSGEHHECDIADRVLRVPTALQHVALLADVVEECAP